MTNGKNGSAAKLSAISIQRYSLRMKRRRLGKITRLLLGFLATRPWTIGLSALTHTMKLEVIFVDWDGTICNSKFWGHWAYDNEYAGASELIQERFFKAAPEVTAQWMRGGRSTEDIVQTISESTAMPTNKLLRGLRESCERMQFISDGILPAVKNLRDSGVLVVVATDNMDTFTRWTMPALDLRYHFDDILDSYSLRALKRDKDGSGRSKFFADFLAKRQINPANTILIDDGAHNAVVEDFGMGFIQITPQLSAESVLISLGKNYQR